jgi:hypothetical protein
MTWAILQLVKVSYVVIYLPVHPYLEVLWYNGYVALLLFLVIPVGHELDSQ